jgi:hypothetical protein
MATLALFAVGSLAGSSFLGTEAIIGTLTAAQIGGAIGGAIGSYIDSAYILPAIFGGAPNSSGPRIDDLRVQTASEGSTMNFCLGPYNRVAGTLIWAADLIETKSTQEVGGGKNGGEVTSYSYASTFAVGVCEGPISRILRIWGDGKLIYDAEAITVSKKDKRRVKSITIYKGDPNTAPDAIMESYLGAGSVPRYLNVAYVVFEHLQLRDFGNRIPQLTFLVEQAAQLPVQDAIGILLERASLDSGDYDVSQVPGCLLGYTLTGPQSMGAALASIVGTYDLRVQETNGQLVFLPIGEEGELTVLEDDLMPGSPDVFSITDADELDIPSSITVTYIDKEFRDQNGSVSVRRIDYPTRPFAANNEQSVQVPFVLLAGDAVHIANRVLWRGWNERETVTFSLPPSYVNVQEGDILTVTYLSSEYLVRVTRLDRGANFVNQIQGTIESARIVSTGDTIPGSGDSPTFTEGTLYDTPLYTTTILDIAALRDEDVDAAAVYYAIAIDDDSTFFGASLYTSTDGSTYSQGGMLTAQSIIGTAGGVLATGPTAYWDMVNTIDVVLGNGTLSSTTEAEVLAGKNYIRIGSEILGFQTATLLSANTYRLSGLLRGVRNTEAYVGTHASGEQVIVLSSEVIGVATLSLGFYTATIHDKGVLSGEDVADADDQTFTFRANMLRHFSPAHIAGTRDTSNNLTVTWIRRSRSLANTLTGSSPLLDTSEVYEIDFKNGGGTVLRTKSVSSVQTVGYTAAEQTTDGLTPGNPVHLSIYQISTSVGRGNAGDATI